MSVIKDGQEVSEVILQEGVPTYERVNDSVAEPVVYMIDRYVVGGFYRVNPERGNDENLNSPGASFVPLAFAGSNQLPKPGSKPGASAPNRFYMYGVIAPPGDGRGQLRARGDRPRRRDLRVGDARRGDRRRGCEPQSPSTSSPRFAASGRRLRP